MVCPPRGYSAHTGRIPGRHKNGEYAAVTRGRPAFQRHEAHAEGSDTTLHAGTPKKRCVQEGTARSSAQSTHSEKAVFSAETTPRGVVPTQPQRPEGNDTTPPHRSAEKMQNGSLITSPNRAPAETQRSGFGGKRTSDRESESCRLRRDEGFVVRSDDGQHRICLVCGKAAALPNALGGAWPHTPKLRAEAHTHSKL